MLTLFFCFKDHFLLSDSTPSNSRLGSAQQGGCTAGGWWLQAQQFPVSGLRGLRGVFNPAGLCPSSQDMLRPATFLGAAGGALGWLAAWETGQESLLGPQGLDGAAVGSVPELGEVWGSWPKRREGPEVRPWLPSG